MRTRTGIGAASTTRRTLTATTASTLALLATLPGSVAAYLALAAGHRGDTSVLNRMPVPDLTITIAGVPAAALAGCVPTGRKPPPAARQPPG